MVNNQLLDYIKQQLAQGLNKETIQQNLTSSGGWNPSDIAEAFSDLNVNKSSSIPLEIEPHNFGRFQKILLGFITGYFLFLSFLAILVILSLYPKVGVIINSPWVSIYVIIIIAAILFAITAYKVHKISIHYKRWVRTSFIYLIVAQIPIIGLIWLTLATVFMVGNLFMAQPPANPYTLLQNLGPSTIILIPYITGYFIVVGIGILSWFIFEIQRKRLNAQQIYQSNISGKKWGFISYIIIVLIIIASLWYGSIPFLATNDSPLNACIQAAKQNGGEGSLCGYNYAIQSKDINICNKIYTDENFMLGCRDSYYTYYHTGPTDINECLTILNATTTDSGTAMNYAAYRYDCFQSLALTTLNKDACSYLALPNEQTYCVSDVENAINTKNSSSSSSIASSTVSSTTQSTSSKNTTNQTNSNTVVSGVQNNTPGNASPALSNSDIAAITTTVQAFKIAFLDNDEQGVLEYSSLASQNIKISQLNTSFKSIGIKSISICDSSCRPPYYTNNNEVSVALTTINMSGVSGNMRWGFVKENGVWKFDLGLTMKLAQSTNF